MKFSTAAVCAVATIAAASTSGANANANANVIAINTPADRALRSEVKVTLGQAADATISVFTIAQSVAPLLAGMFGSDKECHQMACWVAAPTYDCQFAAANQVQRELMKGRNSFAVGSSTSSGMWVRYWRAQFSPPDRGAVADGKCGGGSQFVVSNCQQTGKVYC